MSYYSKIIDPVIYGFIPNDKSSHLHIYNHVSVKFGIREICIGFSNTSHVDILDRFIWSVVDNINSDICIL